MKITLLISLLSFSCFAAVFSDSTRILNGIDENRDFAFFTQQIVGLSGHQMYVDGQASADRANPTEVFVPVQSSSTMMPDEGNTLLAMVPNPGSNLNEVIHLRVYHDVVGDREFWVGRREGTSDSWDLISTTNATGAALPVESAGNENNFTDIFFRLSDVFDEENWSAPDIDSRQEIGVFALIDEEEGERIDVEDYETEGGGALFFEINISNETPEPTVNITDRVPLDGQAEISIARPASLSNLPGGVYALRVYVSSNSPIPGGDEMSFVANELLFTPGPPDIRLEEGIRGGSVLIENLINNIDYYISAAYVSRYQIVGQHPAVTITQFVRPDEILTFLREQSCFIVSAGFGEKHFVLDYFRNFRDEVLSSSYLGKKFIKWYYRVSPDLAQKIYHIPLARLIVRIASYVLYFLMNYFYVFAGTLLISALIYKKRYLKIVNKIL